MDVSQTPSHFPMTTTSSTPCTGIEPMVLHLKLSTAIKWPLFYNHTLSHAV